VVLDVVAALVDLLDAFGEAVDGVTGREERRRDAQPIEAVEDPRDGDPGAVLAARELRRAVGRVVGVQPDRDRVEVESETDGRVAHGSTSPRRTLTFGRPSVRETAGDRQPSAR
jgi:hypothetical protein